MANQQQQNIIRLDNNGSNIHYDQQQNIVKLSDFINTKVFNNNGIETCVICKASYQQNKDQSINICPNCSKCTTCNIAIDPSNFMEAYCKDCKPIKCHNSCGREFKTIDTNKMLEHLISCTERPVSCPLCDLKITYGKLSNHECKGFGFDISNKELMDKILKFNSEELQLRDVVNKMIHNNHDSDIQKLKKDNEDMLGIVKHLVKKVMVV
jgi:hypothetical protein